MSIHGEVQLQSTCPVIDAAEIEAAVTGWTVAAGAALQGLKGQGQVLARPSFKPPPLPQGPLQVPLRISSKRVDLDCLSEAPGFDPEHEEGAACSCSLLFFLHDVTVDGGLADWVRAKCEALLVARMKNAKRIFPWKTKLPITEVVEDLLVHPNKKSTP